MKHSYCNFLFLILATLPFFVTGCASNPPVAAKEVRKEAPAPVVEIKKEIIFPLHNKAIAVSVANGDVKRARMEAAAGIIAMIREGCGWKKPLKYYGEKVVIEAKVVDGSVLVRARMDSSLCPEKN